MSVQPYQSSVARGHTALWLVSAWALNGSVGGVTISLSSRPSDERATYTLGCGSEDGAASCKLGTVSSNSATRELQAGIAVASIATSVTSVDLTATAKATSVPSDPSASESVPVTATQTTTGSATPPSTTDPGIGTTLPVGTPPTLPGSTTQPGGSAGGLFPTISPSTGLSPSPGAARNAKAREAADDSTLPLGLPVVGAQIVGLIVLALGLILTVTRLSLRGHPAAKRPPTA